MCWPGASTAPTALSDNLPALHRWLRDQGVLVRVSVVRGYINVIRRLVSASANPL
jgi:hypothetical protein